MDQGSLGTCKNERAGNTSEILTRTRRIARRTSWRTTTPAKRSKSNSIVYIIKSHVVHRDRSRVCLVPHATGPVKKDPETIVRGSYPVHFALQPLSQQC